MRRAAVRSRPLRENSDNFGGFRFLFSALPNFERLFQQRKLRVDLEIKKWTPVFQEAPSDRKLAITSRCRLFSGVLRAAARWHGRLSTCFRPRHPEGFGRFLRACP
jgi:hypothetical protein